MADERGTAVSPLPVTAGPGALHLARVALVDLPTAALAAGAAVLLARYRVNSAWLVLGGSLVGLTATPGFR